LTAGRPHPLRYGRTGQYSLTISGALRLIFKCGNNPVPKKDDNTIDWNQVTDVIIISIEDYHE
jgi:plasmid maintenance system killer protein